MDPNTIPINIQESIAVLHQRFADLERYLEERFKSQERSVETAMAATDKAATKAEAAMERRFDSVNEFRGTLSDQASKFATRTEVDVRTDGIAKDLATTTSRLDKIEAKSGGAGGLANSVAIGLSLIIAIAAVIVAIVK